MVAITRRGKLAIEEPTTEMAMRREESDGRVVPNGRRKAVPTAGNTRGGKATTANERAGQRDLFLETADSRQGAVPGTETGQPAPSARYAVPKSRTTPGETLPAMTMKEVASDGNLGEANFLRLPDTPSGRRGLLGGRWTLRVTSRISWELRSERRALKSTNSRKKLLDESFTARAAFGGISAVDSVDEFDDTDSRNSGLLVAGRIDDTGPTAR
jgi:hypothetical protein